MNDTYVLGQLLAYLQGRIMGHDSDVPDKYILADFVDWCALADRDDIRKRVGLFKGGD